MTDTELEKPVKRTHAFYDWHECEKFIEAKYGFKVRDVAGKWTWSAASYAKQRELITRLASEFGANTDHYMKARPVDYTPEEKALSAAFKAQWPLLEKAFIAEHGEEPEYQDFWHWIVGAKEINNGSTFSLYKDDADFDMSKWQKRVLMLFIDEFGDKDGEIEFEVSW